MTEQPDKRGASRSEADPAKGRSSGAGNWGLRFLMGLVAATAVAGAVAGVGCGSTPEAQPTAVAQATPTSQPTPRPVTIDAGNNPSKGPADAKVTVVEFSDFQGAHCASFALQTLPQILADYGDKVRFVFMNTPLKMADPYSEKAAEAGECANAQGAFWQYHDLLFQNQQVLTGPLTPDPAAGLVQAVESFKGYAAQLGLDTVTFNDCLDSGKMATAVQADEQVARKAVQDGGLTNDFVLPAFFINGNYLGGAKPYDVFSQTIDMELAVAN